MRDKEENAASERLQKANMGHSTALSLLLLCSGTSALGQADEYDAIYKADKGKVFLHKPNAFLVEVARERHPGRALDVGMGQGRNSIYLAEHGWDVTGFDVSDVGVRMAREEATRRNLKIVAFVTPFEKFDFGANQWDLIVITYEPTRSVAPKVVRALKPGGAVVVEDRHRDTRKVWPDDGLFANNELLFLFPTLRVLRYEDFWGVPDWQVEKIQERMVRLLAEKPKDEQPGCIWKGKSVPENGEACWDRSVKFQCIDGGWIFTHQHCN